MCRVNPNKLRTSLGEYGEYEWTTDWNRNTRRPYRILFHLND